MDSISNLPNEIICHIVSFLSAKEAAFTLVLSKRFRNLFTIIPDLRFIDVYFRRIMGRHIKIQSNLIEFVGEVLAMPSNTRLRKFSLYCDELDPADYAHVNRCLCDVLKRGVMKLKLDMNVKQGYSLPSEVFTCKTLVKLKLGTGLVIDSLSENAFLPVLESLFLGSVRFYDHCGCCTFQKLLSACPVIDTLVIDGVDWEQWKWSRTVSCPTLRVLNIKRADYDSFDGSDFKSITFDTPNLGCLVYSDFVPKEYPVVNLDSLLKAKLHLVLTVNHTWNGRNYANNGNPFTSDPTNLIKGLRNVRSLDLVSTQTLETLYYFHEAIPVFEKLCDLSFKTDYGCCWRVLPFLLNKSPNLQILVIDGPLYYNEPLVEYSCLLSCPVKFLEVSLYMGIGRPKEMSQIKLFLENLPCLELLKVFVLHARKKDELKVITDLQTLPRASSKCKIEIEIEFC